MVTPFLPGDSLLFVAGALAALGGMEILVLLAVLTAAAILGNTVNYAIGSYIGPRVFYMEDSRFFKKAYLERTHAFFEKYGPMTIVIGRFLPIIRTFAPFVAGVGAMTYSKFIVYNVVGGIVWVALFTLLGYFFGNMPFVQQNFEYVVIAIVLISLLPMVWEYVAEKQRGRKTAAAAAAVTGEEAGD